MRRSQHFAYAPFDLYSQCRSCTISGAVQHQSCDILLNHFITVSPNLHLLVITIPIRSVSVAVAKVEISDLYVPQYVFRGRDVRLACQYRTVGTRVYAVKWFKNKNEFYRFVPQYDPPKKTFHVPGFSVDVSTFKCCV